MPRPTEDGAFPYPALNVAEISPVLRNFSVLNEKKNYARRTSVWHFTTRTIAHPQMISHP